MKHQKYLLMKTKQVITLRPLNLIDYNRERAFEELKDFCGFEYYGAKHLENVLTAFIQLYWLPKKFGVDKRTSHLSSMIASGQMTREEALLELDKPLYDETLMASYIGQIKQRLSLSDEAFDAIMAAPGSLRPWKRNWDGWDSNDEPRRAGAQSGGTHCRRRARADHRDERGGRADGG